MSTTPTPRTGDARPARIINRGQAFMLSQAAHAVERLAASLEALADPASPRCWQLASQLIGEHAAELARLGDVIREASGEAAEIDAAVAEFKSRKR